MQRVMRIRHCIAGGTVAALAALVVLCAAAAEPVELTQGDSRVIVRLQVVDKESAGSDPARAGAEPTSTRVVASVLGFAATVLS